MNTLIHLIFLLIFNLSFSQTKFLQILNSNSSLVIEGKVISSSSNFRSNGDIVTNYFVKKTHNLKGSPQANIKVQVLGGQVDDHFQIVSHQVKLKTGDKGIFFLRRNSSSTNYFFKGEDYFINYAKLSKQQIDELNKSISNLYPDFEIISQSKNTTRAVTSSGEITSVLPKEISAGINSDLTIRGTGFGNNKGSVGFLNANDGGASYFFTHHLIKSWTNTEIVVTVPQLAGTGRIKVKIPTTPETSVMAPFASKITIPYSRFTITTASYGDSLTIPLRHIGAMPNGANPPTSAHLIDGAYHFKMFSNFYNNESARTIFLKYLEEWSCKTGINFLDAGVKTLEDELSGSLNEVRFSNFDEQGYGGAAFTSIKGVYTCPSSSSSPDPESITAILTEIDFVYDNQVNWGYDTVAPNEFDFSFTTAHEIGHAVLFYHVIDNNSLMHYAGSNGYRNVQEIPEPFVSSGITGVSESISPYPCGDPMTVSSCYTLSKKRIQAKKNISVTKSGSTISVKTNNNGKVRLINVYDLSGKVILEIPLKKPLPDYSFDLPSNSTQIYLLKLLFDDDIIYTSKLII